ncbi:hypothetical protein [Paenibacillus sp. NPDC058071]|uniref:hypothetical protein n=1 Tax=Paenibacillus sp. NPDC058071 TaxID=3346326 RepID=UPI0036D9BD3D
MRLPPFYRYVRSMQSVGMIVLGMVIGAAVYHTLFQARFEALVSLKSELEMQLDQYETDMKNMRKLKNQHNVIKSVLPRIEKETDEKKRPPLDKVTEAELTRRIKQDLSVFIGQSIYEIDSDAKFARMLLSQKIYSEVLGKDYKIDINTILVADNVLQVWVKVRLYEKPPS